MNHLARRTQVMVWLCVLLCCLGFVGLGCVLLPYNGIQEDEALVAGPIFGPVARDFRIRVFHRDLPLMTMDYNGALKSWIYWPIFHFTKASPTSLRLPVLLAGAVTIGLFYLLLHRIAGTRAALAGCFLLATDTTFLLTTEFDWGPVALQHLMLVTACLCLFEFRKADSPIFLAAGFFALGLGLWDKALFAWVIGGLVIASAAVFPKQVFAKLTLRNVGVALSGFLLGVWPLVIFNARHQWPTIRNHASFSAENLIGKADVLWATMNGSGLFGYMVNEPASPVHNLLIPALLISLIAMPLLNASRRAILFALVFMAATWIQMVLTRNAGAAAHHTVLLWPFPQFVVAISFAELSRRWTRWGRAACTAAITILCAMNLLVTNQYLTQFIRYGPSVIWTDAIYPLSDSLREESSDVFVMDWDIFNPLLLLHQGKLKLVVGFEAGELNPRLLDSMLGSSQPLFVAHTRGNEFFPAANRELETAAVARGYRKQLLRTVGVFEVYRFIK